ncbi:MAG: protein with flavin oxidoreductase domain [Idiomarinaceae bacterium HL-53]|nr:MAG: protein with flavin oxidoreductase domain [Idiomarinaceae bacterium HL-53]CUS48461.1 NADH-FMN oxidoreductase RutF, flavin reductase (DIM6/NTAB) family [Idiomarinaceae bacterium HL-53]
MYWLTQKQIAQFPDRFRARLINCLSGYKSANLIGTANTQHQPNLAIVSSVVHLGANPPLIGMVTRPRTVRRDTVNNIRASGFYTINAVSESMIAQAHQTSAQYPCDVSEFAATGLNVEWVDSFAAPAVAESPLSYGLELKQIVPIELNGTEFIIGEIKWLRMREQAIRSDGFINISELKLAAISGLDSYHIPKAGTRYEYALPEEVAGVIPDQGAEDIQPAVDLSNYWQEA